MNTDSRQERPGVERGDVKASSIRTWATLRIAEPDVDPKEITAFLGVTPSNSFSGGQRRGNSQVLHKHGQWSITSENVVTSDNLEAHIAWVLDQVEPASSRLRELLTRPRVKADIFCFWESPFMNSGITLSASLMARAAALGLTVGIDIYSAYEP